MSQATATVDLRTKLVEFLVHLPSTYSVRERVALIDSLGLHSIVPKIEWEGSTLVFFSRLIDVLALDGQASLIDFIYTLQHSELLSRERKDFLTNLYAQISKLSKVSYDRQFLASKIHPDTIINKFRKATLLELRALGGKYIPALYVPRKGNEAKIREFLEGDETCFVLVAKAGRGKTNLFCHMVEQLIGSRPVLFLPGRTEVNGPHDILDLIAGRLGYGNNWLACFEEMSKMAVFGLCPVIFIDGINENSSNPAHMQGALRELLFQATSHHVKVCVSCRSDFWQFYRAPFWREYSNSAYDLTSETWQESVHDLPPFTTDEFSETLDKYFRYFQISGELVEDAYNQCRHPLLLRFFCEAYRGNAVGNVSSLRLYALFKIYWLRKIAQINELSKLPVSSIQDALLHIAGLMLEHSRTRISRNLLKNSIMNEAIFRILDEEIILEEVVDDLISTSNIVFVYDRFCEFAISLYIFRDLEWNHKPEQEIFSDFKRLISEEENAHFPTLRGVLEFLVLLLEDRRPTDKIHYKLVKFMFDSSLKWKGISISILLQFGNKDEPSYYELLEEFSQSSSIMARRLCASQIDTFSEQKHASRSFRILARLLDDQHQSVRQAAKTVLLRLRPEALLKQLLPLASPANKDTYLVLIAESIFNPDELNSPAFRRKLLWLIHENNDHRIKDAVMHYFNSLKISDYSTFYRLEKMTEIFADELKMGNIDCSQNSYYIDICDFVSERGKILNMDIKRLQIFLDTFADLIAFGKKLTGQECLSDDYFSDLSVKDIVPREADIELILDGFESKYGKFENRELWFDKRRIPLMSISYATIYLAMDLCGKREEFEWAPKQIIRLLRPWEGVATTKFSKLLPIVNDISKIIIGKIGAETKLHLDIRFDELGLAPEATGQFVIDVTARFNLHLNQTEQHALSSLGRLILWIWQKQFIPEDSSDRLTAQIEKFRHQSVENIAEYYGSQNRISFQTIRALSQVCGAKQVTALVFQFLNSVRKLKRSDLLDLFVKMYICEQQNFWPLLNCLLNSDKREVSYFGMEIAAQIEYMEQEQFTKQICTKVIDIVAQQLEVDSSKLGIDARFDEDLKADSLAVVEIILAIEESFKIAVPDEDTECIYSIRDIVTYISLLTYKLANEL